MRSGIRGLVAAVHTPFDKVGELALDIVQKQAEHLSRSKVHAVFIGGTTGECHSLSLDERQQLALRWIDVAPEAGIKVIVHVGSNCIADACTLAEQAERFGVAGISAHAPSYFKPDSVESLIRCCEMIAGSAPSVPFYFYDIPSMTGVSHSMFEFLDLASKRIPNLAGLKFTNTDLTMFLRCKTEFQEQFEIYWGTDELLLPALACGADSAVGSTYNFAAQLYYDLLGFFAKNEWQNAREMQLLSIELVQIMLKRGFMASAKATMRMLGVDVGPPRLPFRELDPNEYQALNRELLEWGMAF